MTTSEARAARRMKNKRNACGGKSNSTKPWSRETGIGFHRLQPPSDQERTMRTGYDDDPVARLRVYLFADSIPENFVVTDVAGETHDPLDYYVTSERER